MRYFFDLTDAAGEIRDTEGTTFGSFQAMRFEAKRALACIAADESYPTDELGLSLRVRDEQDREVYNIRLSIKGERS